MTVLDQIEKIWMIGVLVLMLILLIEEICMLFGQLKDVGIVFVTMILLLMWTLWVYVMLLIMEPNVLNDFV